MGGPVACPRSFSSFECGWRNGRLHLLSFLSQRRMDWARLRKRCGSVDIFVALGVAVALVERGKRPALAVPACGRTKVCTQEPDLTTFPGIEEPEWPRYCKSPVTRDETPPVEARHSAPPFLLLPPQCTCVAGRSSRNNGRTRIPCQPKSSLVGLAALIV